MKKLILCVLHIFTRKSYLLSIIHLYLIEKYLISLMLEKFSNLIHLKTKRTLNEKTLHIEYIIQSLGHDFNNKPTYQFLYSFLASKMDPSNFSHYYFLSHNEIFSNTCFVFVVWEVHVYLLVFPGNGIGKQTTGGW